MLVQNLKTGEDTGSKKTTQRQMLEVPKVASRGQHNACSAWRSQFMRALTF